MTRDGPFITKAFFCQELLDEAGVHSALRITDSFTVRRTLRDANPADFVASVTHVTGIAAGTRTGDHEVRIEIEAPSGELLGTKTYRKRFDGANDVKTFITAMDLPFRPGVWWFDVLFDGEFLTRTPLRVSFEDVSA